MITPVFANNSNTQSFDNFNVNTEDFIKLMLSEIQNQDPLEPMSNADMMAQISELTSIQLMSGLTESISGLSNQNRVLMASNLLGKQVEYADSTGMLKAGRVADVQVNGNGDVQLGLDTGVTVEMDKISRLMP